MCLASYDFSRARHRPRLDIRDSPRFFHYSLSPLKIYGAVAGPVTDQDLIVIPFSRLSSSFRFLT
jgi:hypothetical protein